SRKKCDPRCNTSSPALHTKPPDRYCHLTRPRTGEPRRDIQPGGMSPSDPFLARSARTAAVAGVEARALVLTLSAREYSAWPREIAPRWNFLALWWAGVTGRGGGAARSASVGAVWS